MFVVVCVVTGILVAGMAIPLTALAAGVARAGAEALDDIPTDLQIPAQYEATTLYLADGSELARFFDENREYVPLDQISVEMQQAQVAIEDHRFYEHGAVDLQSVIRAALGNAVGGEISGGGSTLSQQYIKQARIQMCNNEESCVAAAQAPTLERKILEMRYAIALERKKTKDEILELYLNIAYYGDGAYGVQSAAHHYFNKDAADLNVAEAAMLAGLVQNPGQSDPVHNLEAALARRNAVLDAQVRYQGMDPAVADEARQVPFDPEQVQFIGSGCQGTRYPFVCDYARRVLISDQMPQLGSDEASRIDTLNRAGLSITVTVDPAYQDPAQEAVSSIVGAEDAVIAVMDSVDPKTGRILAMAQSRPVMGDEAGQTYINYSVTHAMGGAEGFGFGSTFKAWTAAAAIQQGNYPDTTYINTPRSKNWRGETFKGCGDDTFVLNDDYTPVNAVAGHDSGQFNMVTGMMWSVNNYWVELERRVGPCAAVDMAIRAGVELSYPAVNEDGTVEDLTSFNYIPAFTLGAPYVTPLSMAVGYGTFANRGTRCNPIILQSITSRDGQEIPVPSADCQQTIDAQVADAVNYVLRETHYKGLSASTSVQNNIDQASKTGTADQSMSASAFVGYTPDISTSVIVAGDNTTEAWRNTPEQARNVLTLPLTPLGGRGLGSLAISHAGALWKPYMERVMANMPEAHFEKWTAPTTSQTRR